ncbi:MAG: hypothetical protein ACYSW3_00305 [Planctomycetota bacterium]|jgi:hypothetical protein
MGEIVHFLKPVLLTKSMVDGKDKVDIGTFRVHVRHGENGVLVTIMEPNGHNVEKEIAKGDTVTIELESRVYCNRTKTRLR